MNKKRMIMLWIAILFVFWGPCFAAGEYHVVGNDSLFCVITGTIEKVTRNAIDIRDEDDKVLKRFIYFDSDVQVGDRVRAHYEARSGRIEQLKKMTKVEYKKDGQNLGYISREVPKKESGK
ncbi:MAG: hypothetical protein NT079_05075 [Candidatus Omnitrophica bacterium]|nr:hypothetical protein [Candidatus Omnitrophota bacterium]